MSQGEQPGHVTSRCTDVEQEVSDLGVRARCCRSGLPDPGRLHLSHCHCCRALLQPGTAPPAGAGLQLHTMCIDGNHRPVDLNWWSLETHIIFFPYISLINLFHKNKKKTLVHPSDKLGELPSKLHQNSSMTFSWVTTCQLRNTTVDAQTCFIFFPSRIVDRMRPRATLPTRPRDPR